jgi:3-oxoacyl-[acyl-carrier protein] reductase/meso-butanediol dehydrogenase/(S,S)-butanediol dehydrogenase/diacetyl reductase
MTKQRTIIVTGGSKGIGAAIVRKFCKLGDRVVFSARHPSGLEKRLRGKAKFVEADARDRAGHRRLVEAALDWTGRLDVYVNCAGVSIWKPLLDVEEAFLDLLVDTNLKGLFWGCQAAAAHFLDQGGGAIVNVSSLAGKRGSANNSVYCASKFGVNGITQALAKELGPRGIRVNAVCPVYIDTPALRASLAEKVSPSGGAKIGPFLDDFARKNAALARIPRADEVADLCAYLASDEASAITGQCINVDCGVLPS